ncbi:MAG: hypothetical protein ACOCWC_05690 [Bacteroidota bacterium]
MDTFTIKKKAKEHFSKQNYFEAINTLSELGINDFISLAHRPSKKDKKNSWFKNSDFCEELSKHNDLFIQMFESEKADELLFDYFNFASFSPDFEKKLAEEFPQQFVKAVQKSHSFLDAEKLELYLKLELPENLKIHQDVWKHLQNIENETWKGIEKNLSQLSTIKGLKLEDILIDALIWFEEIRFTNTIGKDLQQDLQHLSAVYNTFIPLIQYYYSQKIDFQISSIESFQESFFKRFKNQTADKNVSSLLVHISDWVNFKDSVLYPYCYDSTISPKLGNGVIYFKRTAKNYYKWKLDGCRYGLNRFYYYLKGEQCVEYWIENGKLRIPKGSQPNGENRNYQLAIQDWQIRIFLEDLKISKFTFQGKKIPVQFLYKPLLAYSRNRYIRYEQVLEEQKGNTENWKENQDGIERFPFFLMHEQKYIERNNIAIKELPQDSSQAIVNLFSYHVKPRTAFNRFNKNYDVWNKPFLKFGKHLFCPIMFLSNNDWFYAFAQAGLENLNKSSGERKTTATEMEKYLGGLFEKKKWKVKVFNDKEASAIDGDVDIAINDENTTLLIQLKRTKFRLDLKESYYEHINTDRKASKQLNNAEKWLSSKDDLFMLNPIAYKWIVSTSFENVLSDVNGCLKVNYFDIIQALNHPEVKTLNDLIEYCEKDKGLQNWISVLQDTAVPDEYKDGILESGLPLPLVEPKFYIQPLFSDDDYFTEYHNKYNKALELGNNGNIHKAIKVLKILARDNPNDYEVWGALGNYYANIKNFFKSFSCFKKALEIIPNDPYILQNYALAHRESGNLKECSEILEKMRKECWFLEYDEIMYQNL